ncbi:MAG: carboxymuconolactone decarboxylase family protein [Dehalococcoidia bacterium]|nr:carboxymuconolactone decarboxylase family protein [Dehalococcoidia bacterium]
MARLPYLALDDLPPADRHAWERIKRGREGAFSIYRLMLNSPEAAARVAEAGDYLVFHAGFPPMERELVILTVARELNCQHEWTIHQPMALQRGVRPQAIEAIKSRRYETLAPQEALYADFTRQVLKNNVTDAAWNALAQAVGQRTAVDYTLVIGFTALICYCMDAFRADLPPGTQPLLPIP